MKRTIKLIAITVLTAFVSTYLAFAFMSWEANPSKWDYWVRVFYILLSVAFSAAVAEQIDKVLDKK